MKNKGIIFGCLIFFSWLLMSCENYKVKQYFKVLETNSDSFRGIQVVYPKEGTIFPPEFPSPTFIWNDTIFIKCKHWYLFISADSTGRILLFDKIKSNQWKPDSVQWEKIKAKSVNRKFVFTVIGYNSVLHRFSSGRISYSLSTDSVGADIFFRAVTLPFSFAVKNVHTIEWYMGSVKGGKPRKMLYNLPVCGNCHSFSAAGGKPLLAMDVDYGNDKGSYAIVDAVDTSRIAPSNIITWSEFKRDEHDPTYGLLSQISPNGRFVLSTVKDLSVFVAVDENLAYSQLFFPIKGIIGIYDRETRSFSSLAGANDPRYVQSNSSWSPDGKEVIFARTEAYMNEKVRRAGRALLSSKDVEEFTKKQKEFKFNLFRIDFNDGKGGVPQPIEGASYNGKSNYFAKYSPDGKWIVFCQAENFMLLQPDSRLYIMAAKGGKPRLMNCNMPSMNSWHSWSPNSKWLVFSSKYRGPYTQLYLTHIDKNGNDSPPVLLENLMFEKRACNIPEFFPGDAKKFKAIQDAFSQTAPYYTQLADDNMYNKYFLRAWQNLEKAIKIDSNYMEAYFKRFLLNARLQQINSKSDLVDKEKALRLVEQKIEENPDNVEFLLLKATLLSNIGKTDDALQQAKEIIQTNPNQYKTYELICSILRKKGLYDKVIPYYQRMMLILPRNRDLILPLIADAYFKLGSTDKAISILNKAIIEYPDDLSMRTLRFNFYLSKQEVDKAKHDLDFIFAKDSLNYQTYKLLAQYYKTIHNDLYWKKSILTALSYVDKQLEANNENVDLMFEKAELLSHLEDWKSVERTLDKILGLFPVNYTALKQKAKIKLMKKQWNDVIMIYSLLEKNYRPEEEFYNNRAIAYINIGELDKALKELDMAISMNPSNIEARYNRMLLYRSLRDHTRVETEKQQIKNDLMRKQQQGRLSDSEKSLLKQL